jgi:phosphatidylserine/phosphatidylglycerophosphate/cardiolipin synthase-like enzyme
MSSQLFDFCLYKEYQYGKNTSEDATEFVNNLHSKIYVVDKKVMYLCSLNFTESGLKFNHEVLIKITDENTIALMLMNINELKNEYFSEEYQQEKIRELGAKIYLEPINDER